jgi:FtsX-like permease family
VSALIAAWRLSLRRTRADWPIVAAAWVVTLLAAAVVAAGPIYWSAASLAGLTRAFAQASPVDRSIDVSVYAAPALVADVSDRVTADLEDLPATRGTVVRDVRSTAALTILARPGVRTGDVAQLGFLDGLAQHATLTAGAWPADVGAAGGPVDVVLAVPAAEALHLSVGDQLSLETDVGAAAVVPIRLVGIFKVDNPSDAFWHGDAQLTSGLVAGQGFRTFGPFLTTPDALLRRTPLVSVKASWRAAPVVARLTVDDVAPLLAGVDALPDRLLVQIGQPPTITTALPSLLSTTERSLLVSRTNLTLLSLQLAVLSAYAVVLVALLLVDHRRTATSMLLSRGGGTSRIAFLALVEGLAIVIPAVLVGPWLAAAAVTGLDLVGPLAAIGLTIAPKVTPESYLAAAAIGLVCVALLVLPAALSARSFAAEQRGASRQETRPFAQRVGLDVAVLAVAAIALWQLRLYGAPLSRTVHGDLGIDPLLVAAPAISMLAGGVVALRLLPLAARAIEGAVARRRGLVAALGSRELARRPVRYTRSILLLMIAISIGVFAVAYGSTWTGSQRDQADYQAGADVRVAPDQGGGALPAWALPDAYAQLDGVRTLSPVERLEDGVSVPSGSADLLAVDADTAAGVVLLRPDLASVPLADMMAALRAGRPDPGMAQLPAGTAYLRVTPRLSIVAIDQVHFGLGQALPASGSIEPPTPLDPASITGVQVGVSAIVRDRLGLLTRVTALPVSVTGTPSVVLALGATASSGTGAAGTSGVGDGGVGSGPGALGTASLDGPLELAGLGVDLWLPDSTVMTDGYLGLAAVAAGPSADGPWTDLPVTATGWAARLAQGAQVPAQLPAADVEGSFAHIASAPSRSMVFGNGIRLRAARLTFVPAALAADRAPVPVIVNRSFAAATAAALGDTLAGTVDGSAAILKVAAIVDAFPTTDPGKPLVVLDEPTLGLLRLAGTSEPRSPDEWWIAAATGRSDEVAATLRASPFDSTAVVTAADLAAGFSTDPVAIGTLGALAFGFVATGLLAVLGLVVSTAVSARERRTEFALLRALGLSGEQLSGWLWLESGGLALASLLAGTSLGLLVAWLVLPFVTTTQAAVTPVPPVIIEVPWGQVLELDAACALAVAGALLVIGRLLGRLGLANVLRMGEE